MSANSQLEPISEQPAPPAVFPISPLIRITLIALYIALTIPLPFLAEVSKATVPPMLLWLLIVLGFVALYGALSQRVMVDSETIRVTYSRWVPRFFGSCWSLSWSEIKDLKLRTTGQGGLVYYFVTKSETAYLLPMRVVNFAKLVHLVQSKTKIDTTDIRPLAQPWMYLILLGCTILLLLIDAWTITTAITQVSLS